MDAGHVERDGLRRDDFDHEPDRTALDGAPDNFETALIAADKMGADCESRVESRTARPSSSPLSIDTLGSTGDGTK